MCAPPVYNQVSAMLGLGSRVLVVLAIAGCGGLISGLLYDDIRSSELSLAREAFKGAFLPVQSSFQGFITGQLRRCVCARRPWGLCYTIPPRRSLLSFLAPTPSPIPAPLRAHPLTL